MRVLVNSQEINVTFGSLNKKDALNNKRDSLAFTIEKYGGKTLPSPQDEIELYEGTEKVFGGIITRRDFRRTAPGNVTYSYEATDYTFNLDRRLVLERYKNQTLKEIIEDLVGDYATEFTTNIVGGDIDIRSVSFSRQPVSECIEKLATLVNYYWYVDYNKVVQVFPKSTYQAPTIIKEDNDSHLIGSLNIADDSTQIRNVVTVQGGDRVAAERTETFDGDGTKFSYSLANKFQSVPVVTVGGTPITVGIDYLNQPEDFDALWNFNEKYLKFTVAPAAGTNNISVTGDPLVPIFVQVRNRTSVSAVGEYEFSLKETSIETREEAIKRGLAELQAYKDGLCSGSFQTYTAGFRSGQIVNIDTFGEGTKQFIVSSVRTTQLTPTRNLYTVQFQNTETLTVIDILQQLLRKEALSDDNGATLTEFLPFDDSHGVTDELDEAQISEQTGPYTYDNADTRWNFSTWAA